ncbi:hypothetical protein [Bradyrhizobium sp. JYMT SZCCT0180]|uniref:hypothetical protein n=1 Tax=Bradyrhizobium sp. JYMT SZCCT0180 TaxID=2807666 RepID=UPI001BAA5549|nr:hypothetical protein [Bradyrhizobium sp. JYMT SZCCT0180]MBR1216172.1 hypothetical protein [Bradyrhizobium sp. JYMT SZCCT0180]
MSGFLAFIAFIFSYVILAAMKKVHVDETGVPPPTRDALKSMRRRARKKAVPEAEYYAGWVERKQKKAGSYYLAGTSTHLTAAAAHIPTSKTPLPQRFRAPMHQPFSFEHLSMMAEGFGWTLRRQAFGLYYLTDNDRNAVVNPYARPDEISTDFNHQDLEDFLLTC